MVVSEGNLPKVCPFFLREKVQFPRKGRIDGRGLQHRLNGAQNTAFSEGNPDKNEEECGCAGSAHFWLSRFEAGLKHSSKCAHFHGKFAQKTAYF